MVSLSKVIRPLKVTFSYLFKRPFTVMYPKETLQPAERYRGIIQNDINRCIGCGACVLACPNQTLELMAREIDVDLDFTNPKSRMRMRPALDLGRCLYCGLCVEACPTRSLTLSKEYSVISMNRVDMLYTPEELAREKRLPVKERIRRFMGYYLLPKAFGGKYEKELMKLTEEYRAVVSKYGKKEITKEERDRLLSELEEKMFEVIREFGVEGI
ncbi:MAG: NADH-quinone oxidoreductase subunit I [Candidatus Odinarchaeota archaeon]|nr:NADH-quinone oxidoreductase subunit I [Candidatus Odinarchaeota archaeon]